MIKFLIMMASGSSMIPRFDLMLGSSLEQAISDLLTCTKG